MKVFSVTTARTLLVALLAVGLFGLAGTALAETITSFQADVNIQEDAIVEITEEITYDFKQASRHGIYRDIPVRYDTGIDNRRIFIDVVSVTQDGELAEYKTTREGDDLRVRIGDSDEKITGEHIYEITYTVRGVLNYFENSAELYWNVTGNGWSVPINSASADVGLPAVVAAGELEYACYRGPVGSSEECEDIRNYSSSVMAEDSQLTAGEGLTVAVSFPKSIVAEPTVGQKAWWWLAANWVILLPLIAFIIMFYLWYTRGRDPEGRGVVVTQYEPPADMRPTMVGALIDEKVHSRDITAGVIYLAEQGFLTIRRLEETKLLVFDSVDYELTLERNIEAIPTQTEKDVAEILFGSNATVGEMIHISELKNDKTVAEGIKKLKQDIYNRMVEKGYFAKNPRTVMGWYLAGGFIVAWLLGILTGVFGSPLLLPAGLITGVIIAGFGYLMPRKTKEGAKLQEHLSGFETFLAATQKERLSFHNAPERTTTEFMEYLPYAIALGVEEKWAGQFADMYMESPEWYAGGPGGRLAATAFASELTNATGGISQSITSAAASGSSGSSGGGFSGGGMGGGGGGSW